MNDTETEARRLLAAATEGMPPGTDLLGGFVAARRRDRTRRTRRRVVLSAGAGVAAAALATASVLTIGSARPALATVTSALTRTLTSSYHLTEQSRSPHGRTTRTLTCTTKADPRRHLEASFCPGGSAIREVGLYTYRRFPQVVGHIGKHWVRIPTECAPGPDAPARPVRPAGHRPGGGDHRPGPGPTISVDGFIGATPQQMLSEIKKAATVTVVGPASGRGWTGTRYAFTVRLGKRVAKGLRVSGAVDVDQQGRARNLVQTVFGGPDLVRQYTQALTFSDFGAPVTVTPPPADQTITQPTHC